MHPCTHLFVAIHGEILIASYQLHYMIVQLKGMCYSQMILAMAHLYLKRIEAYMSLYTEHEGQMLCYFVLMLSHMWLYLTNTPADKRTYHLHSIHLDWMGIEMYQMGEQVVEMLNLKYLEAVAKPLWKH